MERLFPKVQKYKKEKYNDVRGLYAKLAHGQSPHTLLITCSDSRLSPNLFTDSKPGEIFVIRNAGNIVSSYNLENVTQEALTIEYGVVALGIEEIVVCGHVSCGAMTGVLNIDGLDEMPLVQKSLGDYREEHSGEIKNIDKLADLIEWNVNRQLLNLYSYPFIKNKVDSGKLNLWGWVFDFVQHEVTYKKNFLELQTYSLGS